MRIRLIAGLLLLGLCAGQATADEGGVVIASGAKGGYYHAFARGLRVVLYNEYGIPTDVVDSAGSMANLAALADPGSLVNVALAQADALESHLAEHPDFAKQYVQIGDAGKECAFLVVQRGSGIGGLDALASGTGPTTIAIGEADSGASITWANMTRLQTGLARVKPVERGVIETLLAMQSGESSDAATAAMMVQRPMAVATPLEIVLRNGDDFALVPILPSDLRSEGRGTDSPVYSFEKVVVGFGRDQQSSVDTLCTRALVLASKQKLSSNELESIREAVATSRQYIMPGGR